MYQRTIQPQFRTGSPLGQVAASQGAGGAIPRGGVVMPQQEDSGIDMNQIGGLLGMMNKLPSGGGMKNAVDEGTAVAALEKSLASGVAPGQIPDNLGMRNGFSGSGTMAFPWLSGLLGGLNG